MRPSGTSVRGLKRERLRCQPSERRARARTRARERESERASKRETEGRSGGECARIYLIILAQQRSRCAYSEKAILSRGGRRSHHFPAHFFQGSGTNAECNCGRVERHVKVLRQDLGADRDWFDVVCSFVIASSA